MSRADKSAPDFSGHRGQRCLDGVSCPLSAVLDAYTPRSPFLNRRAVPLFCVALLLESPRVTRVHRLPALTDCDPAGVCVRDDCCELVTPPDFFILQLNFLALRSEGLRQLRMMCSCIATQHRRLVGARARCLNFWAIFVISWAFSFAR